MSHALLSPSSAERWINCPPSASINAAAEDRDTPYTRAGTLAHKVAELKAREYFITHRKAPSQMRDVETEFQALAAEAGEETVGSWAEMQAATDQYLAALKDAAGEYVSPYVALEQRVDMSEFVPDGFGTADCIMVGGSTLHIIDFKYGKGVAVSADANPQLMLYAAGAVAAYDAIYDIDTVRISIVQPRLSAEPSTWGLPRARLEDWAHTIVTPAAKLAAAGAGEFHAGPWCRFCAAHGRCRAQADEVTRLQAMANLLPPLLADAEIGPILDAGAYVAAWLETLREYALNTILTGGEIPGYKAVEGRHTRTWTDEAQAIDAAARAGLSEDQLWVRKPATLAALEKVMGKPTFGQILGAYVTTKPGTPTLAPESDKRPPITQRIDAAEEFKEVV